MNRTFLSLFLLLAAFLALCPSKVESTSPFTLGLSNNKGTQSTGSESGSGSGVFSRIFGLFGRKGRKPKKQKKHKKDVDPESSGPEVIVGARDLGSFDASQESSGFSPYDQSFVANIPISVESEKEYTESKDQDSTGAGTDLEDRESESSGSAPVPDLEQTAEDKHTSEYVEDMKSDPFSIIDFESSAHKEPESSQEFPLESEDIKVSDVGSEGLYDEKAESLLEKSQVSRLDQDLSEELKQPLGELELPSELEHSREDTEHQQEIATDKVTEQDLSKPKSSIEDSLEEEPEKSTPNVPQQGDNHFDASYESNLEEMEKSVTSYRDKFNEKDLEELPHEVYDRMLKEALSPKSQSEYPPEKSRSVEVPEKLDTSINAPDNDISEVEKYLEGSLLPGKASEAVSEYSEKSDKTIIDLGEKEPKYPVRESSDIGPEDFEDFLVEKDIRVSEPLEEYTENKSGSERISSENIVDSTSAPEVEGESISEGSSGNEETSKQAENSPGLVSRVADAFRNFTSIFKGKESSPSQKEHSAPTSTEEKEIVLEEPEKEQSEQPLSIPEVNKSRVKTLIEQFERENPLNKPIPTQIPRNRLGLRNIGNSGPEKNIDNLINFFEKEDIKAREEAQRYNESKQRKLLQKLEGPIQPQKETDSEPLKEPNLEESEIEGIPESSERREEDTTEVIGIGDFATEDSLGMSQERSGVLTSADEDEIQEDFSLPVTIPSIDDQNGLVGGVSWALSIGKYLSSGKNFLPKPASFKLSDGVLILAPSGEQIKKLLQLSEEEVSSTIMELVASTISFD
ncbi:retinitis pigmentosa GTPase regulator-like protein [Cryptosporidium felis]|nr:retinitis pigmentosa GTPase regulator-like protein [Cryptosporidium felis]